MQADLIYLDLLKDVLANGVYREGRNGGTYGVFGRQVRFNLAEEFPLLTTKRVHWKSVLVELIWLLSGDTNIQYMKDHGVTIWDEWADEDGELGPVYGKQWRAWQGISYKDGVPVLLDQIENLIKGLRSDPFGRRHIVTAWNPAELPDMALPPCHCFFQCFVSNGKLDVQLYQRSADIFLGVPFNIASYALLTHVIAHEVGLEVGEFVHTFGDLHLYANHKEQALEQLTREPRKGPAVSITKGASIFGLTPEHVQLIDYNPHAAIAAPVSV